MKEIAGIGTRRRAGSSNGEGCASLMVLLVIIFVFGMRCGTILHVEKRVITVRKLVATSKSYKAYSVAGDTYSVNDSFLDGHFRSSDLFGALDEGRTYSVVTRGVRFGLLSWYPNIIKARELPPQGGAQ